MAQISVNRSLRADVGQDLRDRVVLRTGGRLEPWVAQVRPPS